MSNNPEEIVVVVKTEALDLDEYEVHEDFTGKLLKTYKKHWE